jgi:alpha-beta hydrolase superfamily lysophospholipase
MSFTRENVRFTSDGQGLVGLLFVPDQAGPHPALVICHGPGEFKENYLEMAGMLAERGIAVLAFDLRGHGESQGERYRVVIREWMRDLGAALDLVSSDPRIDGRQLAAFGISSGGTAILERALVDPRLKALVTLDATVRTSMPPAFAACVYAFVVAGRLKKAITGRELRVPLAKLGSFQVVADGGIEKSLRADPRTLEPFLGYPFPGGEEAFFVDTLKRVDRIKAPTLVLWGAQDKLDTVDTARLLYSRLTCPKQLHIIPQNGHAGHLDAGRATVFSLTADWLLRCFRPGAESAMPYEVVEGEAARAWSAGDKWRRLSPFLRQHGREALSYATLQSGLEYFIGPSGYIAYITVRHPVFARKPRKIAFSDPVCSPGDLPGLLRDFLAVNPRAAFGCVSEACAALLRGMGFKTNCLGPEAELSIQTYNTKGNWKELDLIKRGRNEARREGIVIREVDITEMDPDELAALSRSWMRHKPVHDREIWIYARRALFEPEADVRKFAAFDREGKVCGFCFYDPMYRDGEVYGYSAVVSRCDESRFGRLATAIHMEAMEKFKAEGREVLSLNLSPFINLEKGRFNDDVGSKWFFQLSERYGNAIYNFRGLAFHKAKYRGSERYLYFSSNRAVPSNDVYLGFLAADITRGYLATLGGLVWGIFCPKPRKSAEANNQKQPPGDPALIPGLADRL